MSEENEDGNNSDNSGSDNSDKEEDSVASTFQSLLTQVESLVTVLETAEAGLLTLQRPMERLGLRQLGHIPFLQSSPFRQESFLLKRRPGGPRVPFQTLCAELRAHCLTLPTEGDELVVSPFLREMLHVTTRTTTFPALLGALTQGLV
jgi:hypothetical protein